MIGTKETGIPDWNPGTPAVQPQTSDAQYKAGFLQIHKGISPYVIEMDKL